MNRTDKQQVVEDLNQVFSKNAGIFLFGFSGIDVPQITELRSKVYQSGCGYRVVKNRLAKRAAQDTVMEQLADSFQGPTAVATTADNPVPLAKIMKAFVKEYPGLEFKGGVLNEKALTASEVEQLAEMPSREELLSKLVYLLQAPLTQFAAALQSPLRNMASLLKQIGESKEETN